jgi:hypothetical protein
MFALNSRLGFVPRVAVVRRHLEGGAQRGSLVYAGGPRQSKRQAGTGGLAKP